MTKETVFEKISKIIADHLGSYLDTEITMKSTIAGDLDMDSMDVLCIVYMMETTLNITIESDRLKSFTTVEDLVNVAMEKLNVK